MLACLAAAFAYGVGANLVRVRFVGEPPLSMAIGQQLAAAVVLLPLIPPLPVRATPDAVDVPACSRSRSARPGSPTCSTSA